MTKTIPRQLLVVDFEYEGLPCRAECNVSAVLEENEGFFRLEIEEIEIVECSTNCGTFGVEEDELEVTEELYDIVASRAEELLHKLEEN
jgi:hypothetical protein